MSIGALGSSEFVVVFSNSARYFFIVDSPQPSSRAILSDEKHQFSGFDLMYAKIALASNGSKGQKMMLFPSFKNQPALSFFSICANGYV
jgi:hypothetical protein